MNNTNLNLLVNKHRNLLATYELIKNTNNPNKDKILNLMNQVQNDINELQTQRGGIIKSSSNIKSFSIKRKNNINFKKSKRKSKKSKKSKKVKGSGFLNKTKKKDLKKYFPEDYMEGIEPRKIKGRSINYTNINPGNSIGWQERW